MTEFLFKKIYSISKEKNLYLAISIHKHFLSAPKCQFLNQVPRIERKEDMNPAVNSPAGYWRYTDD